MTRQEYLNEQVENLINGVITPLLQKQELSKDIIQTINTKGFLYSVGRLDALEFLMIVTRYLNDSDMEEVYKYFREKRGK